MGGKRISNNSEGNSKISGALSGGIVETLLYGKEKKSAIGSEIGKIKGALSDFPQKVKNEKKWIRKTRKEERNNCKVGKLETRGGNLHLTWVKRFRG